MHESANRNRKAWLWRPAAVALLISALGACTHGQPDMHRFAPVRPGPVAVKANADPTKAIPVVVCDATQAVCQIPVTLTQSVPVLNPQLDTFECDISVAEAIVTRPSVKSLRWKLPDAQVGDVAKFRFRKATARNTLEGITPYARAARNVFTPKWSALAFDFETVEPSPVRQPQGFAYGIYLEWSPSGQDQWQTCTPLDPIIITHP